jgi:hypothetical protein
LTLAQIGIRLVLLRSPELGAQVDDDTTPARLAYRTARTQQQTARLTLAITIIGLTAAVAKATINLMS